METNAETTLSGLGCQVHARSEDLEWSGLFALALVRVGRHLEVKAINKARLLRISK